MPVILVNKVVDKKRIVGKMGEAHQKGIGWIIGVENG
jgi:hypothetical protein